MPVWKILFIGVLACTCLALTFATVAIPIAQEGALRWVWLGGLLAVTFGVAAALTAFLRHASGSLDLKPVRGARW